MINPAIAEVLARDHQLDLQRAAQRRRLARQAHAPAHRPAHASLRTRAGWWMVHAGIRLALAGDGRPEIVPAARPATAP